MIQELKERWESPISGFWKKIQKWCITASLSLVGVYISIAGFEATGYYKAPQLLLDALKATTTFCVGVLAAAKFTKTDIDPTKVDTPEKKVEAIKEIISVENIKEENA